MIGGEYFPITPAPVEDSLSAMLQRSLGGISFFASGRDALATLLAVLPQAAVSLPSLICSSVYDVCRAAKKTCIFYHIGENFLHDKAATAIRSPSIVFVMHYFGVHNEALIRQARNTGPTVISDVTHLLFDRVGLLEVARTSDFLIASLRKSGPFPDGGFISSLKYPVPTPKRGLREDFSCSYLSRQRANTVSVDASARVIRHNIDLLTAGLRGHTILPVAKSLISLYFTCIFDGEESRDHVRKTLASNHFFFLVHLPSANLPVVSSFAIRSLSIPCDARYDRPIMKSILKIIKSCLP